MTWPAAQVKTSFDQSSDDPKVARSEIAGNVDKFNQMRTHVSSYIQGLLDNADAAAARTTLGLVIGTNVQALDATLTSLAAVAGVAGDILYASGTDVWARLAKGSDGEVLTLASGIPSWSAIELTRDTAVATTSGTAHGFTGIAAGASAIAFMLDGVSLSGDDEFLIQLGDAGGYETDGYVSVVSNASASTTGPTSGYLLSRVSQSGRVWSGVVVFRRQDALTWVLSGGMEDGSVICDSAGSKTLTAELTQIQIKATGSNTFDAGSVNILVQ